MAVLVEPHPEFCSLTEAEIERALADPDPGNPIAVEIARLVHGYTANFQALVQRLGRIPTDIMHVKPRWPIEAVAMRLTTQTIRESLAEGNCAARLGPKQRHSFGELPTVEAYGATWSRVRCDPAEHRCHGSKDGERVEV